MALGPWWLVLLYSWDPGFLMDLVGGNLAKDDFLVQMYQKNGTLSSEA